MLRADPRRRARRYGCSPDFYGISLPWLAFVLIYISAVLFFIYLACRRKMTSERIHPLSKPQSIAALATLAVLLLGTIWRRRVRGHARDRDALPARDHGDCPVADGHPDAGRVHKGPLAGRTSKGCSHLPSWDDLSLNRVFLVIACAIVLVTATFAWTQQPASRRPAAGAAIATSFPLAIASGVLVVAYFGLAMQYFLLRFGDGA